MSVWNVAPGPAVTLVTPFGVLVGRPVFTGSTSESCGAAASWVPVGRTSLPETAFHDARRCSQHQVVLIWLDQTATVALTNTGRSALRWLRRHTATMVPPRTSVRLSAGDRLVLPGFCSGAYLRVERFGADAVGWRRGFLGRLRWLPPELCETQRPSTSAKRPRETPPSLEEDVVPMQRAASTHAAGPVTLSLLDRVLFDDADGEVPAVPLPAVGVTPGVRDSTIRRRRTELVSTTPPGAPVMPVAATRNAPESQMVFFQHHHD